MHAGTATNQELKQMAMNNKQATKPFRLHCILASANTNDKIVAATPIRMAKIITVISISNMIPPYGSCNGMYW